MMGLWVMDQKGGGGDDMTVDGGELIDRWVLYI